MVTRFVFVPSVSAKLDDALTRYNSDICVSGVLYKDTGRGSVDREQRTGTGKRHPRCD